MIKKQNLLPIITFLSGCCGLAYEVLYNRVLTNVFGDSFGVSFSILFTFLFGLAFGYLFAHKFKKWLFAIEIFIGIFAISSIHLIQATNSYASDKFLSILPLHSEFSIIYAVIFLIIPSTLIGISIPVLSSYMTNIHNKNSSFDKTYFFYNVGAAITILIVEFIILQFLPISQTMTFFGIINIIIGICLFLLKDIYNKEISHPLFLKIISFKKTTALILFCIVSACFQLLLLKMTTFVFGPFRENFSLTVFIAITYIWLGTYIQSKKKITFEKLIQIGFFLIILEIAFFKPSTFLLSFIQLKLGNIILFSILTKILLIALWGLPLITFGMSVPVILKESIYKHIENASGLVLFYSSAGNAAGYLLMFFLLHPFFSYRSIFIILLIILILSFILISSQKKSFIIKAAITTLLVIFLWDEKLLFLSHSSFLHPSSLIDEYNNISKIEPFKAHNQILAIIHKKNGKKTFFINGYHSVQLGNNIEKLVGVIPKLIQPQAKDVLVLGLGSGTTAGAASRVFTKMDVVEINKAVVDNQERFSEYNNNIHKNKNVNIILDDGISYLKKSSTKYDVVINTVTTPLYFSSSKLYTKDFFEIVKKRLTNKGVYYTWFDNRCGDEGALILIKTLLSSFRYCGIISLRKSYFLLYASDNPFPVHNKKNNTLIKALTNITKTPYSINTYILSNNISGKQTNELIKDLPIHTIDFPALEYKMARLNMAYSLDKIKRLLNNTTSFNMDPLTQKPYSQKELRNKYLYYSLYVPYLSIRSKFAASPSKDLSTLKDSLIALKESDETKIDFDFLKKYLKNRLHKKTNKNRILLKNKSFPNKEILILDSIITSNQNKECLELIYTKIKEDDDNPFYHALAGICQKKAGNFNKAIEHFEKALKQEPCLQRIRLYLANIYYLNKKDSKKAASHLSFLTKDIFDADLLEKIYILNEALPNKIDLSHIPFFSDLAKNSNFLNKNKDITEICYDFLFFDILRAFYTSK